MDGQACVPVGQDRATTCMDAQAGWAVTGADSSSELGYLVPELWVPGADEVGQGENWRWWSSRKPPICPLILDSRACNGTILTNCLKQNRWQVYACWGTGKMSCLLGPHSSRSPGLGKDVALFTVPFPGPTVPATWEALVDICSVIH